MGLAVRWFLIHERRSCPADVSARRSGMNRSGHYASARQNGCVVRKRSTLVLVGDQNYILPCGSSGALKVCVTSAGAQRNLREWLYTA
jgi:hypothetical protein